MYFPVLSFFIKMLILNKTRNSDIIILQLKVMDITADGKSSNPIKTLGYCSVYIMCMIKILKLHLKHGGTFKSCIISYWCNYHPLLISSIDFCPCVDIL